MVVVLAEAVPLRWRRLWRRRISGRRVPQRVQVVMAATATVHIAITATTAIAAATPDIMVDTTNLPTAFLRTFFVRRINSAAKVSYP